MLHIKVLAQIGLEDADDCDAYITDYGIDIFDDDADDTAAVAVGTATAQRLHTNMVLENRRSLTEVGDDDSQIMADLTAALGDGDYVFTGPLQDKIEGFGDVFLITDITVESDEHKNTGVELLVANRILETLGDGCCAAFYYYGNQAYEVPPYLLLGFKDGLVPGFLMLDMSLWRPRLRVDDDNTISIQTEMTGEFSPLKLPVQETNDANA